MNVTSKGSSTFQDLRRLSSDELEMPADAIPLDSTSLVLHQCPTEGVDSLNERIAKRAWGKLKV